MKIRILTILFIATFFVNTGCKKTKPPRAIVTVILEDKTPVEGATVTVYSKPSGSIIMWQKTTDSEGQAEFEADQEYVLSCKAEKDINGHHYQGTGTLVFKYNEEFEKTIIIK